MADSTSSKILLVAAASAAAGSLATYAALKLLNRDTPAGDSGVMAGGAVGELHKASSQDPLDPNPRKGYLSWDDYFMAVAFLSAQRSKDPNKQVGACIVDQTNVICGIGYNGFPRGCADAALPWAKQSRRGDPLDTKYPYVCHAEMNAILNKNGASVAGARVYVTMFPCNECAKLMIQAGIREVVYHEDKDQPPRSDSPITLGTFNRAQQYEASRHLLALAGVRLRQHLFRQPVLLRLSNDAGRPAAVLNAGAAPFVLARAGSSSGHASGAATPTPLSPAVAAVLQGAGAGSGDGSPPEAAAAQAGTATADAGAEGADTANGAAPSGRRRRGRRQSLQGRQPQQPPGAAPLEVPLTAGAEPVAVAAVQ